MDEDVKNGVATSIGVSIAVSIVWLFLIHSFASCLIWAGLFFSVALSAALFIYMVLYGTTIAIIIMGLYLAVNVCWIYWVRDRIAMAAAILETAVDVASTFWGVFVCSVVMLVVSAGLITGWAYSSYCTVGRISDDNEQYGAVLFYLLSLFWIINVCRYVIHATGAGVTGVWFFMTSENDPSSQNQSASYGSLCRALTTSLGSICYGALIISVIEVMRVLARSMEDSDNAAQQFIGCCLDCLLACVEDILEFINSFAFTICAIYGDDYCTAVSKTMDLFMNNGWDLIINDDLTEGVLMLGAAGCGCLSAAAGYLEAAASNDNDHDKYVCAVAGFLIGLGMVTIVNSTIIACVNSIYVCFAQAIPAPRCKPEPCPELCRDSRTPLCCTTPSGATMISSTWHGAAATAPCRAKRTWM